MTVIGIPEGRLQCFKLNQLLESCDVRLTWIFYKIKNNFHHWPNKIVGLQETFDSLV